MASTIEARARELVAKFDACPGILPGFEITAELREAVHASVNPLDDHYRRLAEEQHHRDGECEIEPDAVVSVSDDGGAYVAAWVWVDEA